MTARPTNVLFLCTGNSARSILAEAILNDTGHGKFRAYSAGSHPKEQVHPETLRLLEREGIAVTGLRSKSWNEYAQAGGVKFDYVITVCNNAAGEVCPIIPGTPSKMHWDIADPAAVKGSADELEAAFRQAYSVLKERIRALVTLDA